MHANENQNQYLFNKNVLRQDPQALGACAKCPLHNPHVSLSLLLTSSWGRANNEAQPQSSHLPSLPRKVLGKYLLGLERRTENQNLLSVAETNWPG